MELLVEGNGELAGPGLPEPGVASDPNDREKPYPAVSASEPIETAKGLEVRVLYDVLGVVLVAQEPARKVVGGPEVRKHGGFEVDAFTRGPFHPVTLPS